RSREKIMYQWPDLLRLLDGEQVTRVGNNDQLRVLDARGDQLRIGWRCPADIIPTGNYQGRHCDRADLLSYVRAVHHGLGDRVQALDLLRLDELVTIVPS